MNYGKWKWPNDEPDNIDKNRNKSPLPTRLVNDITNHNTKDECQKDMYQTGFA